MAAILVTMSCICDLLTIRNNKETGLRHREVGQQLRVVSHDMSVYRLIIV